MKSKRRFPQEISTVTIDGRSLAIEDVVAVARSPGVGVTLAETAKKRINESGAWVTEVKNAGKPVVYGINTGFGSKANVSITPDETELLQRNLILSHCAGVGRPLDEEIVRATMLLRANTLALGYSGVRLQVIQTLIDMLNHGVHPIIPAKGSVGASGDLAPLSHLALVMSTYGTDRDEESGEAFYNGKRMTGKAAMKEAGIGRIVLSGKEGLALNNGVQLTTAIACLAVYDAGNLIDNAEIGAAMSLEACRGALNAFREELHAVRPLPGQVATASKIRELVDGSELVDSLVTKVQDSYSLRCTPQVLGPARDTIGFVRNTLSIEINSATDNPLIFMDLEDDNKALSGGNFHGEPIGLAMDFLGIAMAEVGSIAERRIFKLTSGHLSDGLPSLLIESNGLNNGFMLAQYTAASLVSENKSLAHPASVDSIPTCEDQEDHVSMSTIAARHAREIVENVETVVGIEILLATQALDFRIEGLDFSGGEPARVTPLKPGKGVKSVYDTIRKVVPKWTRDRLMYPDMNKVIDIVRSGALVAALDTMPEDDSYEGS